MKIAELEENSKVIDLIGTITQLDEPKAMQSGTQLQEGILSDETGQVKVTFWGDQVNKYKANEKIRFITGWCKSFNNELQVSTGKFGKIEYAEPKNMPV